MMTDLETMKAMIGRAGLKLADDLGGPYRNDNNNYPPGYTCLVVEGGYFGFFSEMVFDKSGALIGIYAWE